MSEPVLYISGPMSGYPQYNATAFRAAESHLRRLGYETLCPLDCGLTEGSTWYQYMRADFRMLLSADAVCTLPGWECSRGAVKEVDLAHTLGMSVKPLHAWDANPND